MRINHILFFLTAVFLVACTGSKVPKDIIPRDKMVDLLTQLHLIDGGLVSYTQAPDTLYKYGISKYQHLFKTFGTDSVQFRKSFKYYTDQSVIFDGMYDDIVKNLTAKTDSLNKVRIAIAKRDSVKNAERTKAIQDSIKLAAAKSGAIKQGSKN